MQSSIPLGRGPGISISDGDLVAIQHGSHAEAGDLVAALVDGQITLIRLTRSPGGSSFPPGTDVPHAEGNAVLLGTVIGTIRPDDPHTMRPETGTAA
ncbi:LexA family protein [Streptomyces sp. NPDC101062]|uniref:LexA family protein n=1 Tax=unclassified Streptomyces TaxID=2593676 RepID=UPI00382CBB5B